LNRLITTFDEVPPLLVASDSHRLQPWCYLLNVTAEVFRPTAASKKSLRLRILVRSARTPPSTFLFLLFSFQTARSRSATFTRNSIPETRWSTGRRFATDDRSAANSLISMRSIRDENARQCQRPWRRRVNGWGYRPGHRRLSTSESTNCRKPVGPV